MRVSSELSEKIEATLKNFVENSEPYILNFDEPIDLRKLAAELNTLPMMFDWSGYYEIRPNSEIVVVDFNDEPYKLKPELDPRICRMILYQGVKKYPQLHELMPKRPSDAEDCRSCNGTGVDPMNEKLGFDEERIVCWCGGLGWLPKGEKQLS